MAGRLSWRACEEGGCRAGAGSPLLDCRRYTGRPEPAIDLRRGGRRAGSNHGSCEAREQFPGRQSTQRCPWCQSRALAGLVAFGQGNMLPGRMAFERILFIRQDDQKVEGVPFGQRDRSSLYGPGNDAAGSHPVAAISAPSRYAWSARVSHRSHTGLRPTTYWNDHGRGANIFERGLGTMRPWSMVQ